MSDPLFQLAGVSSGIAWDEIINKTLEKAKKPAEQWQSQIDKLEVKKYLYQDLSSQFNKLRNSLTSLRLEKAYKSKMGEFTVHQPVGGNADSIVKATVQQSAEYSSWEIEVKQTATAQRHISKRFSDQTESLGISGSFRLHVGRQFTTITIESGDTIRDINLKVQKATDQNGKSMNLTSKLVDNRLVIESANTGTTADTNESGGVLLTMPDDAQEDGTYHMYLPRTATKEWFDDSDHSKGFKYVYPPQILSLASSESQVDGSSYTQSYLEGKDFTYDSATGLITWLNNSNSSRPAAGTELSVEYTLNISAMKRDNSNKGTHADGPLIDRLPSIPSGIAYDPVNTKLEAYYKDDNGVVHTYKQDVDFEIVDYTDDSTGETYQAIKWISSDKPPDGKNYEMTTGVDPGYEVHENVFYMEPVSGDYGKNSILDKLGFIDVSTAAAEPGHMNWSFADGSYVEAQNAVFTVDGIPITRTTNTIDDVIANVSLELKGAGKVTMDITQDLEETVELLETFVEEYNKVMMWINTYVNQKEDAANPVNEDDYLSSIIGEGKGNTVFGVLHGDQLLWSIKNQMRTNMSNPIPSLSSSVSSRKYLHTTEALNVQGSFYLHVGLQATRIDVEKGDSLTDIQDKIAAAKNIVSSDGKAALNNAMTYDVQIRDGQLVVSALGGTKGSTTKTDTFTRKADQNAYDLAYAPVSSAPVSGTFTVVSGSKVYEEGTDFDIATKTTSDGALHSQLVWREGRGPAANTSFNVRYTYNADAVYFEEVSGSGGDVGSLDLHSDISRTTMATLGFTTDSQDYGKSGYIEFDADVFVEAVKNNTDLVSNVMTTFMRDMDKYIGNLVDTSSILVAGSVVTKGRIAGALNKVDDEIGTLNERITKLETELKNKQTAMYKQYSDMEVAIQKLNAQLSSITQYFSNTKSNNS